MAITREQFEAEFSMLKNGQDVSSSWYKYIESRFHLLSPEAVKFIADGNVPGEWLRRKALSIVFEELVLGGNNE
jgi:hypothetical protein